MHDTPNALGSIAYCIWSVIQSQSAISIVLVSFIGLFCKRDLHFEGAYYRSHLTAYCIWSVIQSQSPISISLVSVIGLFCKRDLHFEGAYYRSHLISRMCLRMQLQPIAFGASFSLNLQSQSPWSLFNGTWQKRPRELENRLRFEIEEMTLQMQ